MPNLSVSLRLGSACVFCCGSPCSCNEPPGSTYRILTEGGDPITTEAGEPLEQESAP